LTKASSSQAWMLVDVSKEILHCSHHSIFFTHEKLQPCQTNPCHDFIQHSWLFVIFTCQKLDSYSSLDDSCSRMLLSCLFFYFKWPNYIFPYHKNMHTFTKRGLFFIFFYSTAGKHYMSFVQMLFCSFVLFLFFCSFALFYSLRRASLQILGAVENGIVAYVMGTDSDFFSLRL